MNAAAADMDAVLLAAGLSRRMGAENKLLLPFGGVPLVRHTASTLLQVGFGRILVVTGHDADNVEAALDGLDVRVSFNPDFASGQMTSVVHGLRACRDERSGSVGTMIALADMPYLQASDYLKVVSAFRQAGEDRIVVPQYLGQRGNPIILPATAVEEAANGGINTGCRKLIRDNPDRVKAFAVENSAYISDIDTTVDYGRAVKSAFPAAPCCG